MLSSTTIFPFIAPKRRLPLHGTSRTTGFAPAGDERLFAGLRLGEQAGESGFGLMDVDRWHDGIPCKGLAGNIAKS